MPYYKIFLEGSQRPFEIKGTVTVSERDGLTTQTPSGFSYYAPGKWVYAQVVEMTDAEVVNRAHVVSQKTFRRNDLSYFYPCSCGAELTASTPANTVAGTLEWQSQRNAHIAAKKKELSYSEKDHSLKNARGYDRKDNVFYCSCSNWVVDEKPYEEAKLLHRIHISQSQVAPVGADVDPNVDKHSAWDEGGGTVVT